MLGSESTGRGPDESYIAATNSSDLTLHPDRIDAATHLIAAALAGNQMGMALTHLRAEWDRTHKPRKATEPEIMARAKQLPPHKGKPDLKRARAESVVIYQRALRDRASTLSGRSVVLGLLTDWAAERGIDPDILSPALFHWLSPNCPVCSGQGEIRAAEAPVLVRKCYYCDGAGTWPRPPGAEAVQDWMKRCYNQQKSGRNRLLHEK